MLAYKKTLTFAVPIEKEATRINKNGEEITKNKYPVDYNLLIGQDFC